MKIAIIGYGYVGKAYYNFFQSDHDVIFYDPIFDGAPQSEINTCELSIVCVPTPMQDNGDCDTSIVQSTLQWLKTPLVLVKSTIPPGTTESFIRKYGSRIAFSPEYIGEGKYFVPFWKYPHPTEPKSHEFLIIGGYEPFRSRIVDILLSVMGPSTKVIKMSPTEAEIVKYMENTWGGTKVTFANEFYEICKAFGADYQTVREGFVADGRVERMHTMVRADARGFGGKCFPKDINAIVKASENAGYEPMLIKQVLESNKRFTA